MLVVAVGSSWRYGHRSTLIPIAVLPLTNLSPDSENGYFADGLTDELIRNLSIIEGLAVRSRTSSFVFKGEGHSAREVGKQLDVDYILEGSVLHAGQQLRINAQLVRVRDDFPLWSGKFDREWKDIFAIQDEISRGIVNSLRLKLGNGQRRYETSPEAYDLFLRGRAFAYSAGPCRLQLEHQTIGAGHRQRSFIRTRIRGDSPRLTRPGPGSLNSILPPKCPKCAPQPRRPLNWILY